MSDYRYHGHDDQAPAARIKDMQRAEAAADVEAFLRNGGAIQQIPIGTSALNLDSRERVHIRLGSQRPGKYTVSPDWESKPKAKRVHSGGREKAPYCCRDCGATDEAERAGKLRLCRDCRNARQNAKRRADGVVSREQYVGIFVRLTKDGQSWVFDKQTQAAIFLGVPQSSVSIALKRGYRVHGWKVERAA